MRTYLSSQLETIISKASELLTPVPSGPASPIIEPNTAVHAPRDALFPAVDPAIDGAECVLDCASCSIRYPAKFSIDEDDELYGHVNGWATHVLVATGKTDWVRDVADEKGSVMEALGKSAVKPSNGVCGVLLVDVKR